MTRRSHRAGVREVLRYGSDATVRLQGTEKGERDSAMIVALARIDGQPCVVIGQDRTTQTRFKPMGPAALREARRGMRLANELRLPLVSFIDTPGAAALARGRARCHRRRDRALHRLGCPRCGCRPSRCCSAKAAAAEHWPSCQPTS
ncbi:carboxyl transferase domain-containing protein [Aeromicrobium sp. UC242_57]|uniref:carboxyl transferase domain-containing protein n=1 Tax=Aeromicrobium sp. UC242_57 TaxID=3374624 RepID=UPI00379F26A2